jgi:hypothetical protein
MVGQHVDWIFAWLDMWRPMRRTEHVYRSRFSFLHNVAHEFDTYDAAKAIAKRCVRLFHKGVRGVSQGVDYFAESAGRRLRESRLASGRFDSDDFDMRWHVQGPTTIKSRSATRIGKAEQSDSSFGARLVQDQPWRFLDEHDSANNLLMEKVRKVNRWPCGRARGTNSISADIKTVPCLLVQGVSGLDCLVRQMFAIEASKGAMEIYRPHPMIQIMRTKPSYSVT